MCKPNVNKDGLFCIGCSERKWKKHSPFLDFTLVEHCMPKYRFRLLLSPIVLETDSSEFILTKGFY